nr:site-specific integrase [Achromobacter ruhlandii]
MNVVVLTHASSIASASEGVPCVLGVVRDDWDAAERWLEVLAARRPPVSPHTLANYRREILRIQWYCRLVGSEGPSRWSIPDLTRYLAFLRERSGDYVCGRRAARAGDIDWTPFRARLGPSALANAQKVLHALLKFWFEAGYRRANPMASIGSGGGVGRDAPRRHAVPPDLIEQVLESMEQASSASVEKKLMFLRDRFILRLLQFTGMRASEVVLANMGDVELYADPKSGRAHWSLLVRYGKGGKTGRVALPSNVMDDLRAYRYAFSFPPEPVCGDPTALILSTRTRKGEELGRCLASPVGRRSQRRWREIRRRATLWDIVTSAFQSCAVRLRDSGRDQEAGLLERASTHWLRHTFGRQLTAMGVDVRVIAKAMRHDDVRTSMAYTELDFLDVVRELEKVRPAGL